MKPLQSRLEHQEESFDRVRDVLTGFQFNIGGNWDYEHGYFDRSLDEAHKVFLRIPFQATRGVIDAESAQTGARVELGQPFVLKHVYNEGLDPEAEVEVMGGLVDQFSAPLDPDAEVEQKWVTQASQLLEQVEAEFLQ
ncbi:YugN family protein [Paenibacillus chartarius]|uniref:YugN family protein n=1 Tax=Paenibacillus chartarius TaxID=747481 RepID=A0ABV6DK73_9BACL